MQKTFAQCCNTRPDAVAGSVCNCVIAGLAEMRTRRRHHRHSAQLTGMQPGIHHAVVRKRANVKEVGIAGAQRLRQSRNRERRPPVLRLPSPIGRQSQQARGAAPQRVVVDREAAHHYAIDRNLLFGKGLETGQPEGFEVVGHSSEDGDAMIMSNQILRKRKQRIFVSAAIRKKARKHQGYMHRKRR
jgi:hypothetical protein